MVRNLKNDRFELDLVPYWVLTDETPNALIKRIDSYDNIESVNHSMRNLVLIEQLFINDLMGVFHFTDGHNILFNSINDQENEITSPTNNQPLNTDTQVKDFNQIVNYRVKSIDLQKGLKFIEVRCGSV